MWSGLVAACELKPSIHTEGHLNEALGQLLLRVQECFKQQSNRKIFYGCVADAYLFDVFCFTRREGSCFITSSKHSGRLQLYKGGQAGQGLELLVALMFAAPETLGFEPEEHPFRWVVGEGKIYGGTHS